MNVVMTRVELERLGADEVAYIHEMDGNEARMQFPDFEGIPDGQLYAVYRADGDLLALTSSRASALAHAFEEELQVAYVH